MVVAIVFWSCTQSEDPLDIQRDNDLSIMTSTSGADDCAGEVVTALSAGETLDIGTITCRLKDNILYIDYVTGGDWVLVATHLDVETSLEGFSLWWSGMPKLHLFPYKQWHFPFVTEYTYTLDLETLGLDDAAEVYISAHAFAVKLSEIGWIEQIASAWGKGERFVKPCTDGEPKIKDFAGSSGILDEGANLAQIIPQDQLAFMEMEGLGLEDLFRIGWPMYFVVNIHEMRSLELWNKLGSTTEVEDSEIGPDGNEIGTITYAPVKFGNGFKPCTDRSAIEFPNSVLSRDNGCIEMWVKPEFDKTLGGRLCWLINQRTTAYSVPPDQWNICAAYAYNTLSLWMYIGGGMPDPVYLYWEPDWAIDDLVHLAFAWGINAENGFTLAIFRNGEKVASTDAPIYGSGTQPGSTLWIGNVHYDYTGITNWLGYIDNVKVWKCPKTDFSDRFEE
jgi:hypothetical protein